jgi:hypothetical protein
VTSCGTIGIKRFSLILPIRWSSRALVVLGLAVACGAPAGAQEQPVPAAASVDAGLSALHARIEEAVVSGEPSRMLALAGPQPADPDQLAAFAQTQVLRGAVRAVVRERDRAPIADAPENTAFRSLIEVFVEYEGGRAAVRTWTLDAELTAGTADTWRIRAAESLSSADGLYRLALDPMKQYRVRDLTVQAEDLALTFPSGVAYAATIADGQTALVVMGDGTMHFTPKPATEQGQLRIFAGETELHAPISSAFLRFNPYDRGDHLKGTLVEEPVSASSLKRAQAIFEDEVAKSFGIELGDLSKDRWSLVPPIDDFLTEIRTRTKFGTLTYVRSANEPEDISVFQRSRRRNIAIYTSAERLRRRGGPAFSEDDDADYDVTHYAITATLDPDRLSIEGRTEMRLTVRAAALATLTFKLAEPLQVGSVVAEGLGRLLALRVRGQNAVIVNLPRTLVRGTTVTLAVSYAGRLNSATPDREALALQQDGSVTMRDELQLSAEPRVLYSNRSYWYPQAPVSDYATGVLRLTVPDKRSCVASGTPASGNPVRVVTSHGTALRYVFMVNQPARYFSTVVSRLVPAATAALTEPAPLAVDVQANPRQAGKGRSLSSQAAAVLGVYGDVLGDYPYPSLTLALVDDTLPGGHSPAYFALVNQPLPASKFSWLNDPVAFEGYPQFFLAHEIAHQFWGGAVGWESYHEQWISEGFAQYFALLYAERTLSADRVTDIRRKLRQTATENADQGPIWLGYRLGHIQDDGRIFRAVVYNKSAMVLNMLRRWLGDEVFFRGLRDLYAQSRYTKIGTRHVRTRFEAASGTDLSRFFDGWIKSPDIPRVRLGYTQVGSTLSVRIDQVGPVMEVPLTVSVIYASGASDDHLVRLQEASTSVDLPVTAAVRSVEVNRDEQALVVVDRGQPPRTRVEPSVNSEASLRYGPP